MGIFINDREWNVKRAKENYDLAEWHLKRAAEAARKKDDKAAKNHNESAKMYKAKGDEYSRDAKRCTK